MITVFLFIGKKIRIVILCLVPLFFGVLHGCRTAENHVGGLIMRDNGEGVSRRDSERTKTDPISKRILYIDEDLLPGGEVTDEITCVYRIMILDNILAEGSENDFIETMGTIDYSNCPADFHSSYRNHIDAWKKKNSREINETWDEVLGISIKYGVIGH